MVSIIEDRITIKGDDYIQRREEREERKIKRGGGTPNLGYTKVSKKCNRGSTSSTHSNLHQKRKQKYAVRLYLQYGVVVSVGTSFVSLFPYAPPNTSRNGVLDLFPSFR